MNLQHRIARAFLGELHKPIPIYCLEFDYDTRHDRTGYSSVEVRLDAKDVANRLDQVVGKDWSVEYEHDKNSGDLVCYPTVCGVTRAGTCYEDNKNVPVMAAWSDVFQCAARKYGIGGFLNDLPALCQGHNIRQGRCAGSWRVAAPTAGV